ncbi:MAG TPA: hypothetical protein VM166_13220 [Gemmatimonadaceae bacterium]|nr:hypothetical protein [Gemmatimonadaceae bacterium]
MTKSGNPRLALVMSAAALVVLAACSNGADDQIAAPASKATSAPKIAADFGAASAGLIQACVPVGTLGGPFTVSYGTPNNMVTGGVENPADHYTWNDVLQSGPQQVTAGNCILIFTKNNGTWDNNSTLGWIRSYLALTITPTTTGGTFTYLCVPDAKVGDFCTGTPSGALDQHKNGTGPNATLGSNPDHGSTVTWSYTLPIATECTLGYPDANGPQPRSSYTFNESEVLRAYAYDQSDNEVRAWYNDEHALLLGQRQINLKLSSSNTLLLPHTFATMAGAVPVSGNPAVQIGGPGGLIATGSAQMSGDGAATDGYGRPLFPAVFVTDLTLNPNSRAGDWQYGGTPLRPNKIFGSWKGLVATIDYTRNPAKVTFVTDADPAKNNWNLGTGANPVPPGQVNQGYGTEIVWNAASLGLDPNKNYRLQFMVHDGDQNKTGGDVGQACMNIGPNVADRLVTTN